MAPPSHGPQTRYSCRSVHCPPHMTNPQTTSYRTPLSFWGWPFSPAPSPNPQPATPVGRNCPWWCWSPPPPSAGMSPLWSRWWWPNLTPTSTPNSQWRDHRRCSSRSQWWRSKHQSRTRQPAPTACSANSQGRASLSGRWGQIPTALWWMNPRTSWGNRWRGLLCPRSPLSWWLGGSSGTVLWGGRLTLLWTSGHPWTGSPYGRTVVGLSHSASPGHAVCTPWRCSTRRSGPQSGRK